MRNYINLVESMMLYEYIVEPNEGPGSMLVLNVFKDMLYDADGIRDEIFSPEDIENYEPDAKALAARIDALPNVPLPEMMSNALEDAMYDGSDAYEDGMQETLMSIYDEQLELCDTMVESLETLLLSENKDEIVRFLLTMIREEPDSNDALAWIKILRERGKDYPEFETIEKSMKVG